MKYIRTKDRIFVIDNNKIFYFKGGECGICETGLYCQDNGSSLYMLLLKEKDIIKQADTIEKIMDGVVVIRKNDNFRMLFNNQNIKHALKKYKNKTYFYDIYGAIWTDKGLIYVAKMKVILTNGEIDWVLL